MTPILQAVAPELLPFTSSNIADAIDLLNACATDAAVDIATRLPLQSATAMIEPWWLV